MVFGKYVRSHHYMRTTWSCILIVLLILLFSLCLKGWVNDSFTQRLGNAEALARQGKFVSAVREYKELLLLNPNSYAVHNDLGILYMTQRHYKAACQEFSNAARLNPHSTAVQRNLGICLLESGHIAKSAEVLRNASRLAPNSLQIRYLLGYSNLLLDHLKDAATELEYVRKHKPGDPTTLFYLVRIYTKQKEYLRGINAFEELEKVHPNSVYVHILRAESYDLQDRPEEAVAEFKKALALDPAMPKLHFGLGFVLWEARNYKEAEREFQKELQINPHYAPAAYYLGDIALDQNNYASAEDFFRQALSNAPGCIDAYVGLGKTYARMDEWHKSLKEFQKANHLDPDQPDVMYWLGTVYRRLGNIQESEEQLQKYRSAMSRQKKTYLKTREVAHGRWASNTCDNGFD
jgi:tetratricopeptide (TPR) repeat protein